jgi:predicted aminopeptidase
MSFVAQAVAIAGGAGLGLALLFAASADLRFLARAAYEEARILLRRRPIEELIADPRLLGARKIQLRLAKEVRDFGARDLGLVAGKTYTHFSDIGRDTLLLVLSASPATELEEHLWRFPIVGTFPYKGFFDPDAALREARKLEQRGLDTYLRPAPAFSTLGWFPDPLLSTALSEDPVQLAATVLHEIAHNTLFVKGKVVFNESFASFVGYRGAQRFFALRGDSAMAERAAAIWRDEKKLGGFFRGLADTLKTIYGLAVYQDSILTLKQRVFHAARECLRGELASQLEVYDAPRLARAPFNNAHLLAALVYRTRLELFDSVLHAAGEDLRAAVTRIREAVRIAGGGDPFEAVAGLSYPGGVPPPPPCSERSCMLRSATRCFSP